MNIDKDIHSQLYAFLLAYGYKPVEIAELTLETRLYHDLGLDGDSLDNLILSLETESGVDLSELHLDKYAPSEGELLSLSWMFQRILRRPLKDYEPLTFGMINEALRAGKWTFG